MLSENIYSHIKQFEPEYEMIIWMMWNDVETDVCTCYYSCSIIVTIFEKIINTHQQKV